MSNPKLFLLSHIMLLASLMQAGNVPTDWAEDGLKGKVRTVYKESAKLTKQNDKVIEEARKPDSETTYSADGMRLKAIRYDWMGNLSETMTYSIVEGDRTFKSEYVHHPYDPPPMPMPLQEKAQKWDSRYTVRHKRRFDGKGRLIEMTILLANGDQTYRTTYKYDDKNNLIEEETYNRKNLLEWRMLRKLDDKGNVIEITSFDPKGNIKYGYKYSYEFDKTGNWTKNIISSLDVKAGNNQFVPIRVEYRKLQYF